MNKRKLSNKPSVRNLVEICAAKGIRYIIICPGSRNAPLNISFNEHGSFKCLSIPDERVAAFVALGIAQSTGSPALICCTSGSAVLNFAPAISEAFYKKNPLLIVSADRPLEWIDQGEGQSIRQENIYDNYIYKSYQLHLDIGDEQHEWSNNRMICEAIDNCILNKMPVHINMPFREPLYETKSYDNIPLSKIHQIKATKGYLNDEDLKSIIGILQDKKIVILCGLMEVNDLNQEAHQLLNQQLSLIAQNENINVLVEHTSNLYDEDFISSLDALMSITKIKDWQPDVLISLGDSFVSKKIKLGLRQSNISEHWHIGTTNAQDVFQLLSMHYKVSPYDFFNQLINHNINIKVSNISIFKNQFISIYIKKRKAFLQQCDWSDLKVFDILNHSLPNNINLHLANSSPIRYIQLWEMKPSIKYFSNRGVSGIDGCTSTAIGTALTSDCLNVLITGDVAFLYDSNAFWQKELPNNLRVIIINNQGGGIFRLIPGPPSTRQLDDYFETTHQVKIQGIAEAFDIPYFYADDENSLKANLIQFYKKQDKPAILEIKTPRKMNDVIYKNFFNYLKL